MATIISAVALGALALVVLFIAAVATGVVIRLLLRGPAAASEAYARGESIVSWWRAERVPCAGGGARLDQRLAIAGRKSSKFGTVMVEERASQPSYGR